MLRPATALLLLLASCSAETPPNQYYDLNAHRELSVRPDLPPGCGGVILPPAPIIDTFPNPTSQTTQPFRGRAAGAALINARGGQNAAQPAEVGTDGRFCIEVALVPDSSNNITFTPIDARGCPGSETTITIFHKSAPASDGGAPAIVQLNLVGQPVTASADQPTAGLLASLVDGDPASEATFSFWDWDLTSTCDKFVWARVDLGKTYSVSKLRVRWAQSAGDSYAVCYALLLSPSSSPPEPDPAQTGSWITVKQEQSGDGSDPQVSITPTLARYVALLLYEDGATNLKETFRVAEIEVWGEDLGTPPPPPDRCN